MNEKKGQYMSLKDKRISEKIEKEVQMMNKNYLL